MKRIEARKPQPFQLLGTDKLDLTDNDCAVGTRGQYLHATSAFWIWCLADFQGNRFAADPFPLSGVARSQDEENGF